MHYLEPLGNMFISVADGPKKLMEESGRWLLEALKSYEQILSVFGSVPNPKDQENDWPDFVQFWEKTFQQTMGFFSIFCQLEDLAVTQKCESLEKTVAEQEKTIRHLNQLLEQKAYPALSTNEEFRDLLVKQQAEFQNLVNTVSHFSAEKKTPSRRTKDV